MIVNSNGKILTVVDAPAEGDAFAHEYWWNFETMYLKSEHRIIGYYHSLPSCRTRVRFSLFAPNKQWDLGSEEAPTLFSGVQFFTAVPTSGLRPES